MGEGFWVLIWDGFGSGLQLINGRLLEDASGRNWWPLPQTGMSRQQVIDYAINVCKLPWLGEQPPPPEWRGSRGGGPVKGWKVVRDG